MRTRNGRTGLSSAIRNVLAGVGGAVLPALTAALIVSAVPVQSAYAQQTSSSLSGTVTDTDGNAVANATIMLMHQPSGTRSETYTGDSGTFFESGLRVGGPYQLIISAPGHQTNTVDNIFLRTGSQPPMRLSIQASTSELEAIVVTATLEATRDLNAGVGSSYTTEDIDNQPATRRDVIRTLLRDPLASSRGEGNLSVAGSNPRFNGLAIDGALQQDDFGLGSNTYATNRSPINLDAVESASLVASDYGVTASGFTGGLVNIITKSGGNEFDGSAFYYYTDEGFLGDKYGENGERDFDAAPFTEREYGVTLGGPIIKDTLFFFVSYDEFESASTSDFSNGDANNGRLPGFFDALNTVISDTFGYDAGGRPTSAATPVTSERTLVKLDWNINEDHRASFTYQNTEEGGTNVSATQFQSAWYQTPVELNAYTLQLFSDWSPNFSTTFRANYKEFERGQNCNAGPGIGHIEITLEPDDLVGTPLEGLITERQSGLVAGCDRFRHANVFNDERTQLFFSGDYYFDEHVLTAGIEYEDFDLFNQFVPSSNGRLRFADYAELVSATGRIDYINATSNDANDGAASWGYSKLSYFVQDTWQATDNLEVKIGFRYEEFDQSDKPVFDQTIATTYGLDTSKNLDGNALFMPRVGFRWTPLDRTTFTGGFGLFAGGDPKVWISNSFQVPTVFASQRNVSGLTPFSVPQGLLDAVAAGTPVAIDAIANDFQTPSDWKASLRWDQGFDMPLNFLGDDWTFTAQYLYTRPRDGFLWSNFAQTELAETQPRGVAPDGRTIYADLDALGINNLTVLGNYEGGSSHTWSVALAKRWASGFDFSVSYAKQDIETVTEGTSSRGISNWRGITAIDRNDPEVRRSPFQITDSFKINLGYEKAFFGDYATRVDLFGQLQSGSPFTYTFDIDRDNSLFGRAGQGESPFDNNPLYIPNPGIDPLVVYASGFDQTAFFDLIEDRGLETGKIHDANSDSSRWLRQWDLRIQQELPGIPGMERLFGDNKLKLIIDVDNVLNLLSSEWGNFYNGPGNNQQRIVRADLVSAADVAANGIDNAAALEDDLPRTTCLAAGDCLYRYNSFADRDISTFSASRSVYRIRIGLRYEF